MKTEKNIYFPLFASRQLNGGFQPEEESKEVWEGVMALPDIQRNVLLSNNLANAIAKLEEVYSIPEQFVEYITVVVREIFFGNFSEQEALRAFRSELAKIPNISLDQVIQYIQLHIFKTEPDPEAVDEEEKQEISNIPDDVRQYILLDALAKYPNLANQFLTQENIKLKGQAAPVRPTISNWLKNYRDELSIGKHDAVARAKFLFESLNTKKLQSWERERIHALVRSLEDNELLSIDPARQEIVFLNEQKEDTTPVSSRQQSQVSDTASPDIFERFQNIPAREDLKNVGTQTFVGEKPATEKKNNEEENVLSRIKNMLVTPAQANAPAPREDFLQASEPKQAFPTEEPLGTLRFSAKHVLPAERKNLLPTPEEKTATPSRLEHFRPQEIFIPGPQEASLKQPQATGPQYTVHTAEAQAEPTKISTFPPVPVSVPSQSSAPLPPKNIPVPPSIFRIKPSKN